MFEHEDQPTTLVSEVVATNSPTVPVTPDAIPQEAPTPVRQADEVDDTGADRWHAEAGRKGALRVQQLIEEGKLYEKEHGLKRGRQRLRQLIELGKQYEKEHGLRPRRPSKRGERLGRGQRKELLTNLLRCLVRIAKPSFRAELTRLVDELKSAEGRAA